MVDGEGKASADGDIRMTVRQRIKRRPVRVFSPFKRAVCDQPERFNMIQLNPMRLYFWSVRK